MGGSLATIPLQGRPAEFKDPNEQMLQMVQLADLVQSHKQQQAMAPYQMEALQSQSEQRKMETAELQRQHKERGAVSRALIEVKGDLFSPDFSRLATEYGVGAPMLLTIQKQLDESVASNSKRKIEELNFEKARDTGIADILETAKDPFTWSLAVNKAIEKGLPPKDGAEMIRTGYDPDSVARWVALFRGSAATLAKASTEQTIRTSAAAEASSKASTRKTTMEADVIERNLKMIENAKPEEYEGLIGNFIPSTDPVNAALAAGYVAQIRVAFRGPDAVKEAKEIVKSAASHAGQLAIAIDPRSTTNKVYIANQLQKARTQAGGMIPTREDEAERGGAYTIDDVPYAIRPMVENSLKYQSALPPQSRLNPSAQAQRWWVMKLDPNYSEELYGARKAAVVSISSGKDKDKLGAMSTALGHVGRLEEAVDALQNNDIHALNALANEVGSQTGSSAPVVFNTIVHRIGPELTQAYVGSGGEASERAQAGGDFDVNQAPDTIRAAAKITAKLLASKMGSTLFYFKQAARFAPNDPRGADLISQFFTPEAIHVMDRMFPGWKTEVEPGAAGKAGAGGGRKYVGKVYLSADKKTQVQYTADGKLWNIVTGKELDPATGKEK